jgi:hypothetical protein
MTTTNEVHADWRCHIGRHHFVGKQDDNPEMRGGGYLECVRCGKKKDIDSYGPMSPGAVGPGVAMG